MREQKRILRRVLLIAAPICCVLLIYTVLQTLKIPSLQIQDIRITATTRIPEEEVKKSILKTFSESYFGGIPYSSLFFYPKKEVLTNLKKDLPIIKLASIRREGIRTIHVDLEEFTPSALWCEGEFLYHTFGETPCFYITKDGYLFDKADPGDDQTYVRYYGNATTTPNLGSNILAVDRFHQIETFVDGIIHYNLPVLGVLIDQLGNHQLYFQTEKNASSTFATLYFNERVPLTQTFENVKTFLRGATFTSARATSTIEYIDARYGNTVFFKTKKP